MLLRVSLAVCCVGMLIGGCGSEEVTFTAPGTVFELDPGDDFVVVLESNPSTGFSWVLEVEPPEAVVRLVDDVYLAPDTDRVGAAGRQELTFEAVGDGSAVIQLWYVRTFDDPPEPADRAEFDVIVGTGGNGEPDGLGSTTSADGAAITVTELLATAPSGPVSVTGLLFDDGSGLRLCAELAESFPPQCPGQAVVISNPDVIQADFTEEAGVRWTDRPVVLAGELIDGELVLTSG